MGQRDDHDKWQCQRFFSDNQLIWAPLSELRGTLARSGDLLAFSR